MLANVYLHYVLDLWFREQVQRRNRGKSRLFRFADDFVAGFEYRHEAAAFEQALKQRLAQYGLEVAPEKTKTIRFGRNGGPHNGRFDFLGFEFRWEPDRKGRPTVKRRTARKKLQGAVHRMGEWLRTNRHRKIPELMKTLAAKLRGHGNYYGVIGNSLSLAQYYEQTTQLLYKWLNRRSQKRSYTWKALNRLMERYETPRPKVVEKSGAKMTESCRLVWKVGQTLAQGLYGQHYRPASALR